MFTFYIVLQNVYIVSKAILCPISREVVYVVLMQFESVLRKNVDMIDLILVTYFPVG